MLGILSAEGLITLERTTQDGTKVKACAGTGSFRKEEKIKAHLKAAEEQIDSFRSRRRSRVSGCRRRTSGWQRNERNDSIMPSKS